LLPNERPSVERLRGSSADVARRTFERVGGFLDGKPNIFEILRHCCFTFR